MTEIMYFHASWCGPCKQFGPLVEKVTKEYPHVKLRKIDIDSEEGMQEGFRKGVTNIPTLATEHTTMVGAKDEQTLRSWLDRM